MPSNTTSITAYTVAASMAKMGALPRWSAYIPEEAARLSIAFMRHACDSPAKRLIGALPPTLFIRVMDAVFIPGMAHHYLFRKRLIEDRLVNAIAEGTQQVVILGGGFDTLAVRMAKQYPALRFFEVDLPVTQQAKMRVLEQVTYPVPPNCDFISADLAHTPLKAALDKPGFLANAPTFLVLEGVLMYLTENEVKVLFANLRDLFTGPLTVIFGAMAAPDDDGNWRVRLVNRLLSRNRERTKWHCPGARMPAFMAELGYEVKELRTYKTLQREYRNSLKLEAIPEEDENYYLVIKRAHASVL